MGTATAIEKNLIHLLVELSAQPSLLKERGGGGFQENTPALDFYVEIVFEAFKMNSLSWFFSGILARVHQTVVSIF